MKKDKDHETIAGRFNDDHAVEQAMAQAVRDALKMHRRIGNTIAVYEQGRIVLIPAPDIPDSE